MFAINDHWVTNAHWVFRREYAPYWFFSDFQRGVLHTTGIKVFGYCDSGDETEASSQLDFMEGTFEESGPYKEVAGTEFYPARFVDLLGYQDDFLDLMDTDLRLSENHYRRMADKDVSDMLACFNQFAFSPGKKALGMFNLYYARMLANATIDGDTRTDMFVSEIDEKLGSSKYLVAVEPGTVPKDGKVVGILIGRVMSLRDWKSLGGIQSFDSLVKEFSVRNPKE